MEHPREQRPLTLHTLGPPHRILHPQWTAQDCSPRACVPDTPPDPQEGRAQTPETACPWAPSVSMALEDVLPAEASARTESSSHDLPPGTDPVGKLDFLPWALAPNPGPDLGTILGSYVGRRDKAAGSSRRPCHRRSLHASRYGLVCTSFMIALISASSFRAAAIASALTNFDA
jgi:hypothetical protein